jgi:hypothetical protein
LIDVAWVADGPRGALTNAYSERVFRAAAGVDAVANAEELGIFFKPL